MSDLWSLAQRHRDTLRFAAFVPASSVSRHLAEAEGLAEAASLLRAAGVTKVYLDVYRAHIPDERVLTRARDFFRGRGFEVSGGLTTVAGNGYGKPSSHGVHWFCWTNRGTQQLVEHVSRLAARLFDEIIVDDFLCTQCRCEECERERGLRDFPRFYREQKPEAYRQHRVEIDRAGQAALAIYRRNVFPAMKVTWGLYPNHVGHTDFPGCFRCHDDQHAAGEKKISQDCNTCHQLLAMDEPAPKILSDLGLDKK